MLSMNYIIQDLENASWMNDPQFYPLPLIMGTIALASIIHTAHEMNM